VSWLTGRGIQPKPPEHNDSIGPLVHSPSSNKGKLLATHPVCVSYDVDGDRSKKSSAYLQSLSQRWQLTEGTKRKIDQMTNDVVKLSLSTNRESAAKDEDEEPPKPKVSFQSSTTGKSKIPTEKKSSKIPHGIADQHNRGISKFPPTTRSEVPLRGGLVAHNVTDKSQF
jgi:hypothetical protein